MLNFEGETEDYNGYKLNKFQFDNCECIVVEPENPIANRQWIWKGEYFTAFPNFELEMLKRGYYLVFMGVKYHFGSPQIVSHWEKLYEYLVTKYQFDPKPILFGLSIGGLYVYNFAIKNPEKVKAIYADNPVLDFKSWPGAKGIGPGDENHWNELIKAYDFKDEDEAMAYDKNPVDKFQTILDNKIPIIHIVATEDEVVPPSENSDLMERRIREANGEITVIHHAGKHHPHGLEDLTPLIDFLEKK